MNSMSGQNAMTVPDGDGPRFFTGAFKARNRIIASVAIVLASAVPFALALITITYLLPDPTGWVAGLITGFAFLASSGLTWVVQNRFALLGNGWLRKRLEDHLNGCDLVRECATDVRFIGFAPGDQVRTWDGETDLDVGFLCIHDGALVFLGDRFSWSLSKSRIDRIDLTPAPLGPPRIVVHWHAPREPNRSFTLESREASSLREIHDRTINLFRGMRHWALRTPESENLVVALGHPPTGDYGGHPVDAPASGSCTATLAMMVIIVLTIWYLAREMLQDGFYYHAILWSGFVFVGGTVFTRCLLHYLQSTSPPPRPRKRPERRE
jgi:hypothetical protein